MSTLISETPRKDLITHLGFSGDVDEAADSLSKLGLGKAEEPTDAKKPADAAKPALAPPSAGAKRHKRLTSIFDSSADSDSFLNDLSASKEAKTNSPFQLFTGEETEADKAITKALVQGQFDKALAICLEEDRMADALMVAFSGGEKCIEKAQEAYFLKKSEGPSYVRLLASIAGKDIWDVVHNADLENWKEIVAVICTFADDKEYPDLCEALGDRLEEYSRIHDSKETRKDASFCYLASSKLEKVVSIWIQELQENENKKVENATDETGFSIHVQVLRDFIEKVTVFRKVSKFEDSERLKASDWKLSSLYDKYIEYAEIVATHGRLDVAEKYLSLLPDSHPAGGVAKNRIQLATKKVTTKAAPKAATSHIPAARQASATLPQQQLGYNPPQAQAQQQQPPMMNRGSTTNNPYAPSAFGQPSNPYAPTAQTSSYAPTGYQAQPQQAGIAPPPQFPGQQAHGVPPPPRGLTQSPSTVGPHTQRTNVPAWNDLPEGFARTPTPRRGTPGAGPSVISSPFPNQPQTQSPPQPGPPPPGPPGPGQRSGMPVPPPPKGPFSPPQATPPGSSGTSHAVPPERPSSTANLYAPPPMQSPPAGQAGGPPHIARTASPYSPPPAGPPPQNRYAPAPSAQPTHPTGPPGPPGPPQQAPGPSPYGAQRFQPGPPPQGPPQGPYAPQGSQFAQPPPPPHTGAPPRQDSRPSTGQSQKKAPAPPKHPAGDRSHIPDNARPIFDILSADMQRVKSRAPSTFKAQVNDTERRLNMLFEHLNNEDLLKPGTIDSMVELSRAIQSRDYETAHAIHVDILTNRTDECGNWMVGVKRLIGMSKATP
ncbi:hypothetical protein FQN49_002141 [Arthroderma sp. PD_2]|nr:hypothetical protein FQN49_002141 [Arthroderma sp. PD_2]